MIIPNVWENKINVPNHQPGKFIFWKNKKLIQVISTESQIWSNVIGIFREQLGACDENEHPRSPGV